MVKIKIRNSHKLKVRKENILGRIRWRFDNFLYRGLAFLLNLIINLEYDSADPYLKKKTKTDEETKADPDGAVTHDDIQRNSDQYL